MKQAGVLTVPYLGMIAKTFWESSRGEENGNKEERQKDKKEEI